MYYFYIGYEFTLGAMAALATSALFFIGAYAIYVRRSRRFERR